MEWNAEVALEPAQTAGPPQRVTRLEEQGKTFVEYALLVTLIAVTALLTLGSVGSHLHDLFAVVADAL